MQPGMLPSLTHLMGARDGWPTAQWKLLKCHMTMIIERRGSKGTLGAPRAIPYSLDLVGLGHHWKNQADKGMLRQTMDI